MQEGKRIAFRRKKLGKECAQTGQFARQVLALYAAQTFGALFTALR